MFAWLKRFGRNLLRKSTHIRHEPINKVSIVILILIDIFVLVNVFSGLHSVSRWPLSPAERFPCYSAYESYHNSSQADIDYITIDALLIPEPSYIAPEVETTSRLGKVSNQCDRLNELQPRVKNSETLAIESEINVLQNKISNLNAEISRLKEQYDSTLLEKIAGQDPEQSINQSTAEQTKADIEAAEAEVDLLQSQLADKKQELITHPTAAAYLEEIGNDNTYQRLQKSYNSATFWHPNQQFALQSLFLLPLILLAYLWHISAVKQSRGTQALLSWHLLLIFCIPFLVKILEFIQFGNLVNLVLDVVIEIFGGLVFISSYLLILVIPLLGFGLIKFLQRFIFNPQVQAKGRITKKQCLQCSSKLRLSDEFCPFCGFEQMRECDHCHEKTYKYTEFCHVCGTSLQQTK